jgi:Fe-S cluster biogenesis protein NfuA
MLEGACRSCPSSGATLKDGIERMLMHWVSEVEAVEEVDEDFAADFRRQYDEALTKAKADGTMPLEKK